MYKIVVLFLFSFLYGIEIDTSIENKLSNTDVKNRLVLAEYYYDKNITKSEHLLKQVLKIEKKNKLAKRLLKKIDNEKEFQKKFKNINIDKFYQKLYFAQNYKQIKKLSKFLVFIKSDYPKIITAKIYFWDGNYKKTKQILKLIKNKNLDYLNIEAYLSFYEQQYYLAEKDFLILYNTTYKLEYAYKLIDTYMFLNKIDKANKFISLLLKKDKNNKKLLSLKNKISEQKTKTLNKLLMNYRNSGKFEDLQKVVFLLLKYKKNDEAYSLLQEYINKNPNDNNAKYWYATYLSWGGNNKQAIKILEKIVNDGDYKVKLLIAKIYSWNGDYKKALNYLNDIISNDEKLKIDAMEVKGLIYYWQHKYKIAKPIFKEVLKYKTSIDAKEALMVINGNIKPLIKKYEYLSSKNPQNLDYILRVAQYSEVIKNIDTAIKYYEKYYKLKQTLQVAHSLAKLYLIKKNYYKAFGYYEYWAYQKGDADSLYELAESYYYAGYSKSALSVISDILNIDKKYKKALELKAKILQYSPQFTQENSKKTVSDIFEERNLKLLTIANRLYFNGLYDDATNYYKEYLLNNPNDYKVRERYAYSLEFSSNYKDASGEFFLMSWQKKDCNILYHYGYNLEKIGKIKLAKRIYKEGLNYGLKPAPKFIINFINEWKKEWETQDVNKYKQYYINRYKKDKFWLLKKEHIFRSVKFISLYIVDISLKKEYEEKGYKYYEITFFQQYTTNKKSDKGYKKLRLKCKNTKCLISSENWKRGKYIPVNYKCEKNINVRLKNIGKVSNQFLYKKKTNFIKDGLTKGGIVIVNNVKRPLIPVVKSLNTFEVNVTKKFNILKGDVNYTINKGGNNNSSSYSKIGVLGYYYEDKPQIKENDYGLFYDTNKFYLDIKKWKLWQNSNEKDGKYLTFHYKYKKFKIGAEIGNYEGLNYLYPYLEYQGNWNYKYYQSITGKDVKSFCAVDKHLVTYHLVASKYKGIMSNDNKELTDEWYSGEISKIDNNLIFVPQFTYRFKKKNQFKNLELYYYLSGWYQINSSPNNCYYSPDFYDSTYLEIHPVYKKLELIGKLGYSVYTTTLLYSYGFNYNQKWLDMGCMKNHSYKTGLNNYWYEECYLKAGVKW